ncbi:unnamed protein product [Arabis nemorensis]|uniref:Uncharacterized protein n=1 Tax=Arabis nemorensis TaxID=586526 RepID=A0A565BQX7_9BRAS|nr:unnamed protein product [Arabis nemorensis]
MAGLVCILRQLGDLTEFAAEMFQDLHEEVMATASRSHGLMARVQQLEAEFPYIEKTLLYQTDPVSMRYACITLGFNVEWVKSDPNIPYVSSESVWSQSHVSIFAYPINYLIS